MEADQLVARQGRELQRYSTQGRRLVVGCIPYRFRFTPCNSCVEKALEVLMISPQKGQGFIFPKGGWEIDEEIEAAAEREAMEEAGVGGEVQTKLGTYEILSKSQENVTHEGHMFPMLVIMQYENWPEKQNRTRKWVGVAEAKEICERVWMKDAVEKLVKKLETNFCISRLGHLLDAALFRESMFIMRRFSPFHQCPNNATNLQNLHCNHVLHEQNQQRPLNLSQLD